MPFNHPAVIAESKILFSIDRTAAREYIDEVRSHIIERAKVNLQRIREVEAIMFDGYASFYRCRKDGVSALQPHDPDPVEVEILANAGIGSDGASADVE